LVGQSNGKPPERPTRRNMARDPVRLEMCWHQVRSHSLHGKFFAFQRERYPLTLFRIGEKFLEWSDEDPSLDTILTNISLYWFTESFARSIYPYRALFGPSATDIGAPKKPLGFSFFPHELAPGIKSIMEKETNLVFYKQHESGGHFAALEKPKELWEDVEEFVGKVWKV
jgi:microsomal epoxide hydrolase